MNRLEFAAFLAGLTAGLLTVSLGLVLPTLLGLGNGFVFGLAIVGVAVVSGRVRGKYFRYAFAVLVCGLSYPVGILTFSLVTGYAPDLLGFQPSSDVVKFGADVWAGLLASALVSALGVSLLAPLLTGSWNSRLFKHLIVAGFLTVFLTFIVNRPFEQYWSFLGVLLPVGTGLFCWLVSRHVVQTIPAA